MHALSIIKYKYKTAKLRIHDFVKKLNYNLFCRQANKEILFTDR